METRDLKISIILPVFNEGNGIKELIHLISKSILQYEYEIIAINDGSTDHSFQRLSEESLLNKRLKVINFKKNYGQTAAIYAGIIHAQGEILITMDSDLENLPSDIPLLLRKLEEGYDVVSGWRKDRWKGSYITRKLPSLLANHLISKLAGLKLHDYGCTLKAYRREVISDVKLYGQMHRFIPVYCKWQGGNVTEVPVNYQPRKYGKSNYGISRTFKVLLDLVMIKFLDKYMDRPIHFFGGAGLISFFIGFFSFSLALYYKLNNQKDFVQTPLPVFTAMFFVIGVLMILMGIIAEILMRTYYESQNKFPFKIKSKLNFK